MVVETASSRDNNHPSCHFTTQQNTFTVHTIKLFPSLAAVLLPSSCSATFPHMLFYSFLLSVLFTSNYSVA
jgi:hypothetical protein